MQHNHIKPLVGVVADQKQIEGHDRTIVMDKYLNALSAEAQVTPFIIPAGSDLQDIMSLLDVMDGLLLPGSPSNIDPVHYGGQAGKFDSSDGDPARDWITMTLIPAVLKRRMPLFGICRGLQEMNVALGGSLYAEIHTEKGRNDHREDKSAASSVQYGPAHDVSIREGGMLSNMLPAQKCQVNSLHGQAVKDLAASLRVEAVADDGVIEAVSLAGPDQFALAVQWHPEVISDDMLLNKLLFKAFGQACEKYRTSSQRKMS